MARGAAPRQLDAADHGNLPGRGSTGSATIGASGSTDARVTVEADPHGAGAVARPADRMAGAKANPDE
ncbi:hypothetical protein J2Z33_000882 [Rubellimicrobium aerolatum]|nr:hypothetical protein [Rubellimicrobium aerolatum]